MEFLFTLTKKDKRTYARVGVISTPHGKIETPAFSPVATKASVKGLNPEDLKETKTQVVLANAYHLYLRPGLGTIEKFGGFAPFMKWSGPTITDSGGYQVSFLYEGGKGKQKSSARQISITDKGMYFRSHIDGSKHLLTPEKSIEIQRTLGADIIMAFDQPMGYAYNQKQNKEAYERSFEWEERSYIAWEKNKGKSLYGNFQALFGIVQGGVDRNKTRKFIKFIVSMNFPGIAIGGEAIGNDPKITSKSLDTISELIPDDKPAHALGLGGGPEGVFAAIERGVDIFDNSSVTRMARTGLLFIYPEDGGAPTNKFRLNIKSGKTKDEKKPISKKCRCYTCENYSRAYVHHLLVSEEPLGVRLTTLHNVHFYNDLMNQIRESIIENRFSDFKKHWLGYKI